MKFKIEDLTAEHIIACRTYSEAMDFCRIMRNNNVKWMDMTDLTPPYNWDTYGEGTCYHLSFDRLSFGSRDYFIGCKYIILEWSDFMEGVKFKKSDLKTGMLVEVSNGTKYLVAENSYNEMIFTRDGGFLFFSDFDDKLKNNEDSDFDIVKVYGRRENNSNFYNYSEKNRVLLCDSKIILTLTIEDIANRFGVEPDEIQIV